MAQNIKGKQLLNTTKKLGTALVTGGAKRIGEAIALELATMGYSIALHYNRSQGSARTVAREIKKKGGRCELFACELTDATAVSQLISQVCRKFSKLNLLVNSASVFQTSKFNAKNLEIFDNHFNVNLKAPFILSSEFFRLCKKGQIINLLDSNIVKNRTSYISYLLTKKCLAEMTKLAAVEFAPHIRVNGICPGLILPPKGENNDYLARMSARVPLQRQGGVSHIRQSIRFLVENDYLTGQFIFNDGGEHLV